MNLYEKYNKQRGKNFSPRYSNDYIANYIESREKLKEIIQAEKNEHLEKEEIKKFENEVVKDVIKIIKNIEI